MAELSDEDRTLLILKAVGGGESSTHMRRFHSGTFTLDNLEGDFTLAKLESLEKAVSAGTILLRDVPDRWLSRMRFHLMNLHGVDFTGANMALINLKGANTAGATLPKAGARKAQGFLSGVGRRFGAGEEGGVEKTQAFLRSAFADFLPLPPEKKEYAASDTAGRHNILYQARAAAAQKQKG